VRFRAPVAALALAALGSAAVVHRIREGLRPPAPVRFEPTLVMATPRLDGVLVRGAELGWATHAGARLRYGDPVSVWVTAYCLKGLTRRDRYVRLGIVASDPKIFPLARYLEIYVGRKYFGRFLVDDTGKHIKGNRLDIWTPTCRDARLFGRQKGTAVLVPRPRDARRDTLLTGRLGGPEKKGR
jgi:3D (Asp-Asp-Asp) domain-containing protein